MRAGTAIATALPNHQEPATEPRLTQGTNERESDKNLKCIFLPHTCFLPLSNRGETAKRGHCKWSRIYGTTHRSLCCLQAFFAPILPCCKNDLKLEIGQCYWVFASSKLKGWYFFLHLTYFEHVRGLTWRLASSQPDVTHLEYRSIKGFTCLVLKFLVRAWLNICIKYRDSQIQVDK